MRFEQEKFNALKNEINRIFDEMEKTNDYEEFKKLNVLSGILIEQLDSCETDEGVTIRELAKAA